MGGEDVAAGKAMKGDLYFTTDARTTLPNGRHVEFAVESSRQWQSVTVDLKAAQRIYQLRIDVADGSGTATIADLKLVGSDGKALLNWTQASGATTR